MKMKTLAMVAASGLLAVSLAHITPVFAEENFDDGMGGQQLAMADTSNNAAIPSDSINNTDNMNQQQVQPQRMDTASNNSAAGPAPAATINPAQQAANPGSSDQPVADVASGDEDF